MRVSLVAEVHRSVSDVNKVVLLIMTLVLLRDNRDESLWKMGTAA